MEKLEVELEVELVKNIYVRIMLKKDQDEVQTVKNYDHFLISVVISG